MSLCTRATRVLECNDMRNTTIYGTNTVRLASIASLALMTCALAKRDVVLSGLTDEVAALDIDLLATREERESKIDLAARGDV